jgi:NADH-quinone oxidoreductase subunit E
MARLSPANIERAKELIGHYPRAKSATIPMCHLAQEQDGYLTDDAMEHIAELVGCTPAEVYGTASFYEMFKFHPVGKYVVGVCTNISCMILGGEEILSACERKLGIRSGSTTADGMFTLEEMECLAACTRAPMLQVNYRYVENTDDTQVSALIDDLQAGKRTSEFPPHGTLARVRQSIPADRRASRDAI